MIRQIVPLFKRGHILRQEMLEAFSDYSYRFGELLYTGYTDGIVSGCRLTTTRDTIIMNQGILCFQGKLFLIKQPVSVGYHPTNAVCILKACYLGEARTESFITYEMDIRLGEDATRREGEIELCRFTLQPGACLRCEYVDFEDRCTEYDTLNTLHSSYAAPGRGTLSPDITRAFAREMLACPLENQTDISFCLDLLCGWEPVAAEAISAYIRLRTGRGGAEGGNMELYEGLLGILREVRNGSHVPPSPPPQRRKAILVE